MSTDYAATVDTITRETRTALNENPEVATEQDFDLDAIIWAQVDYAVATGERMSADEFWNLVQAHAHA